MAGLVVVGASLAGLRAVEAARQDGYDGPVTLVGAETHVPYDRPPLSKAYLDAGEAPPEVIFKEEQHLREDLDVQLILGEPATRLDTGARQVFVGEAAIGYDALVIATGATARTLPGSDGIAGVHTLRTLDDAAAVRAALDAGARTVVVGAGFIGSEVASGARKRGLEVTVIEASDEPLARAVGSQMGTAIANLHHREGTDLRCGVSVDRLESRGGKVTAVHLADGTVLPADLVVVGIGAFPATGWLAGSGLDLENGVVCDENLKARGVDAVYAAGDVARWHNALFDTVMRIEHWTSAAEQGARAARNALWPEKARPYVTVPYFWSDWYSHRIQFVGATAADEVKVVSGDLDSDKFVALYRRGDTCVGALTLNGQAVVMKYRALIQKGTSWEEACAFTPPVRRKAAV